MTKCHNKKELNEERSHFRINKKAHKMKVAFEKYLE